MDKWAGWARLARMLSHIRWLDLSVRLRCDQDRCSTALLVAEPTCARMLGILVLAIAWYRGLCIA